MSYSAAVCEYGFFMLCNATLTALVRRSVVAFPTSLKSSYAMHPSPLLNSTPPFSLLVAILKLYNSKLSLQLLRSWVFQDV
jgi:hypothetical protein